MMTPTRIRSRFPRFAGITTKITLVTAVALIVFAEVAPRATRHALNWTVGYLPPMLEDAAEDRIFIDILNGRADPGRVEMLVEVNEALGFTYFVLDADGRVAWRAPDMVRCSHAALELRPTLFVATRDGERVAAAWVRYRPLMEHGDVVGSSGRLWLIPLAAGAEYKGATELALAPESKLVRGMQESDRHVELARSAWPRRLVALAVSALVALPIGLVVSLLVTRRIRGLANEAAASDDGALPGPFTVGSRDEIGRLAAVLNIMRTRIVELMSNLTSRDEKRRRWLAQVSHDIRTPLTSALVSLNHAEARLEQGRVDGVRETLAEVSHDIRRLGAFADDLFELSRLELEPLRPEQVLPNELIGSAALSVQAQARHKGIEIEVVGEPDLAAIEADGHYLVRACENLLTNAIRYAKAAVRITAQSGPDGITFAIRDDGPGFGGAGGEVNLDDAKAQADSTGLGLTVVRRIAEAHGGRVVAENLDRGAVVRMVIPAG